VLEMRWSTDIRTTRKFSCSCLVAIGSGTRFGISQWRTFANRSPSRSQGIITGVLLPLLGLPVKPRLSFMPLGTALES